MIGRINGRLIEKSQESVVVDVGGVGYELTVPLSTYVRLPDTGEAVSFVTRLFLKDDALHLYGFLTHRERDLFGLLISVSGIGPRLARNILSGMGADELAASITEGNVPALKALPGVGKKTAERVVLELRDKVAPPAARRPGEEADVTDDPILADVASALRNLGFKPADAREAAERAREHSREGGFEDVLKRALKSI